MFFCYRYVPWCFWRWFSPENEDLQRVVYLKWLWNLIIYFFQYPTIFYNKMKSNLTKSFSRVCIQNVQTIIHSRRVRRKTCLNGVNNARLHYRKSVWSWKNGRNFVPEDSFRGHPVISRAINQLGSRDLNSFCADEKGTLVNRQRVRSNFRGSPIYGFSGSSKKSA